MRKLGWLCLLVVAGCALDSGSNGGGRPPSPVIPPSNGPGGGGSVCEQLAGFFRGCGNLPPGPIDCDDNDNPCLLGCAQAAGCTGLNELLCAIEDGVEPTGPLLSCVRACEDVERPFICDSGEQVDEHAECDGFIDCEDGSDEACEFGFDCGDGSAVPDDFVCDDVPDCANGSDELDCGDDVDFVEPFCRR